MPQGIYKRSSKKCKDFISSPEIEGKKLHAYKDTSGIWTIGCGHTHGVHEGMVITEEQCDEFLSYDLTDAEGYVNRLVNVALNQNQFDALVSFVFNEGVGQFQRSTLLKLLNAGDYAGAEKQFKYWIYDDGKVQPGLVKRRRLEAEMFATP